MQQAIVIVLVTAATLVTAWKLMPARRRLRLLLAFDAWLAHRDLLPGWRMRVLARRIQEAGGAGCAGCAANTGVRPNHPRR
jgi:hypothetical protein